jgi:hypothetical protein
MYRKSSSARTSDVMAKQLIISRAISECLERKKEEKEYENLVSNT